VRVDVVQAPNPGLMTGPGTNTWVLESDGRSVVIDPGPVIPDHQRRIRALLGDSVPVGVLVTHAHPDHAPAANPLAAELNVPTFGRSGGPDFVADRVVGDGDEIEVGTVRLAVLATPGHTSDSTCYRVGDALFTGDHIMGGSTVVVEDMAQYMDSLERLSGTGLRVLYPGHGPAIDAPDEIIEWYLQHRRERETEILEVVRSGATTVDDIVETVYREVDPLLHPVAAVSVAAHLRKLAQEGRVEFDGPSDVVRAAGAAS
jgi:glyoxylase-like metal-dependent hydrolase (beta-lactamase superfamily II)